MLPSMIIVRVPPRMPTGFCTEPAQEWQRAGGKVVVVFVSVGSIAKDLVMKRFIDVVHVDF